MESSVAYEDIKRKGGFPITISLFGLTSATATNYGVFYTAPRPCEIMLVSETHRQAGTDAGSVTLNLEILDPGEALDAGDEVLVTPFNLKSTANTPVEYSGTSITTHCVMKQGQRLALKDAGTLSNLIGVCVTVYFKYSSKGDFY